MRLLLAFASILSFAFALYDSGSPVKVLNAKEFAQYRKKHPLMLVEFFAPWCGHCQALKDTWEGVAKAADGIIPVVAIDGDTEKELSVEFGIKGFPTIKMVSQKGAVDYKGERSASGIISFMMDQTTKFISKRAGVSGGSSKASSSGGGNGGGAKGSDQFFGANNQVISLTDDNFDSVVAQSPEGFLVMFYAPWCGHCKNAKPEFARAAKELSSEEGVKLAAVDCTAGGQEICQRFGVQGYPTFKFFGEKKNRPIDYQLGRDKDSFVQFAKEHSEFARQVGPVDVVELTSQEAFDSQCLGKGGKAKQLCVIAFLPDLLDSKAAGRTKYIQVLESLRDSSKGKPYAFLWAQGGVQVALENNFGVGGFGYPALVVLSPKRNTFVVSNDAYSADASKEFLRRITNGFIRPLPIAGELASIVKVQPWDGGEAQAQFEEEEISLEELMKDEL